jgi:hypothetical protein
LEGHFYIFGFLSIKKNYSKVFSTLIKRWIFNISIINQLDKGL